MITHATTMVIVEVYSTSGKRMQSWVYLTLPEVKPTQRQWRGYQEISEFLHHWIGKETKKKNPHAFVFSYIPPSILQILQRGRWIPNPVQSHKKAVVITIYELSQQTPRSDSVATGLHWITHYTVRTREKIELLNRLPWSRTPSLSYTHRKQREGLGR